MAISLDGLSGTTFQVLKLNRETQSDNPEVTHDLHYISHMCFIYKENECLGIKFLQQSLGVNTFSGTFKIRQDLNKHWKTVLTTNVEYYDNEDMDFFIKKISGGSHKKVIRFIKISINHIPLQFMF